MKVVDVLSTKVYVSGQQIIAQVWKSIQRIIIIKNIEAVLNKYDFLSLSYYQDLFY